jgi:hypothetical protein
MAVDAPGERVRSSGTELAYRDTVALRAGCTVRLLLDAVRFAYVRGGLGFETSPIPPQPGWTNLLDSDRAIAGLGAALDMPPLWGILGRLQGAVQVHWLPERRFDKRIDPGIAGRSSAALGDEDVATPGIQVSNPGYPAVWGGGVVLTFFATLEGQF